MSDSRSNVLWGAVLSRLSLQRNTASDRSDGVNRSKEKHLIEPMASFRTRTGTQTAMVKALHWLAAILALAMLAGGLSMIGQEPLTKGANLSAHSGLGLLLVGLMLVRLAWRSVRPPLVLPDEVPLQRRWLAGLNHRLLYLTILFQGMLGIWMAASMRLSVRPFEGFDLGLLAPPDPARAEALRGLHQAGAWFVLALVVLHITGALWHHFIRRDDVLVRMLPGSGIWYRLTAEEYARRWRFPSSFLGNWPKRQRLKVIKQGKAR